MSNSIFGGGEMVSKAYAQEMQNKMMASQAQIIKTAPYAQTPVGRYSIELRPRAVVYEVDGGWLVQMVPDHDGELYRNPKFAATEHAIGDYILQQRAKEELGR